MLTPQHGVRTAEITQSLAHSRCFSGEVALDQVLKDRKISNLRVACGSPHSPLSAPEPRPTVVIINPSVAK